MKHNEQSRQWLIPSHKDGKYGLKNLEGNIVVPHLFDHSSAGFGCALVEDQHGLRIFDGTGYELRNIEGVTSIAEISENFLQIRCKKTGVGGYASLDLSQFDDIPCKFRSTRPFRSGVASVEVLIGHEKLADGLIDQHGEFLIEPKFLTLSFYDECSDVLPFIPMNFKECNNWGLMDKRGRVVVEPSFDWCGWCSDGLLVAKILDDEHQEHYGLIDPHGEWKLKPSWDGMSTHVTEGSLGARIFGNWGIINTRGDWIVEPRFASCSGFQNGLALASIVCRSGMRKFGFLNHSGEWAIQPIYDDAFDFRHGLAEIEVFDELADKARYGFVDQSGCEYWVDDGWDRSRIGD